MAWATRADEFVDSFGIDTHLDYTDGKYSNIAEVIKALQFLGLEMVRDHAPNPASDVSGQNHIGEAAAAGIQFVFSVQREVEPEIAIKRIHAFLEAHPGSVVGIEGPNEVNNWPVTYEGLTGKAAAVAYQEDLFDAANADPLLKDIPVLSFTGYTTASASDYTTIHTYAKDGDQPYSWLSRESADQKNADPGKPLAITETGYHTSMTADTNGGWEGVDEATQAKLLLNTLMDGAWLGSKQTFVYELLDAYADPAGSNQEKHFGLFRLDYSAKPAAVAVHNLTTILADTGSDRFTFTPGALDYTIHGLPSTARSLLTAKSDGSYQIIVWNEPDIWNEVTDRPIQTAPVNVTVDLGASFGTVEIYDPLSGTTSVRTLSDVSNFNLDIVDHPIIIHVSAGLSLPRPDQFGSAGNDAVIIDESTEIVDERRGGGNDVVHGLVSFSLQHPTHAIGNVENLTLTGSANLNGSGDAVANIPAGNFGDNLLDGRPSADWLVGQTGNDIYGNPATACLSYNLDTNARGACIPIATLENVTALQFDDFLIL